MKKRSNAPIFWALFGAGGMLSALIGPVLVLIVGVAVPLGILLPADTLAYPHALAFSRHVIGKLFLFVLITLFFCMPPTESTKACMTSASIPGRNRNWPAMVARWWERWQRFGICWRLDFDPACTSRVNWTMSVVTQVQ